MKDWLYDWAFWLCQKTGHIFKQQKNEYGFTWKVCRLCGTSLGEVKENDK